VVDKNTKNNKMEKNIKQKNKEGIANIIGLIGVVLIIFGTAYGFSNIDQNWDVAFLACLSGTILTFVGNYLRNGYIKFFN
jgi:hypothetical protein